MAVDNEIVKKTAGLSRLKIEDDKVEATKREFNKILAWIDELNKADTDNVEPLISVNDIKLYMRSDEVTQGNQAKEILQNAPSSEYGYFAVPKVVE